MKKLNVKAVVIDLRHVSEETLASYEHIQIHAALAMTGPRTEALLAKYPERRTLRPTRGTPCGLTGRSSSTGKSSARPDWRAL